MISRRHFLTGLFGVTVALPVLESLLPKKQAKAGTGDPLPYAIFIRQANGFAQETNDEPERFFPRNLGALTAATMATDSDRAVSELALYVDKMIVLRGVNFAFPGNGCGHSGGGNQCLTAAKVSDNPSGNQSLSMGESIDNRIAAELNPQGVEPLALYAGKKSGYIDEVMSYRGALDLRAAEHNPFNAYQKLFGLSNVDPEVLKKLAAQRASVNDLVRAQMQSLLGRKDLSQADRSRLDLHFQSIRDLEVNLTCSLPMDDVTQMEMMSAVCRENDNIPIVTRMQMDILALAMACGVSRAATMQIGDGNDSTEYTIDGLRQKSYHKISHRIDSDGDMGPPIDNADVLHHKIDRIHGAHVKYLCDKLSAYTFANGSLLDYGVVVWLNDLANKWHSYDNVPHVLIGSANGYLKTGQYVDAGSVNNNKLLNTLATAVGCTDGKGGPLTTFGDPSLEPGLLNAIIA